MSREHHSPVAAVKLRGLGLTPRQTVAALNAAERFSAATGLDMDTADEAILRLVEEFSPKPQRPSPYSW